MKTHYSWETEEEGDWAPEPATNRSPSNSSRQRRPLLLVVFTTIVVFVAIFIFFDRRLGAREEIVRQNVLAAHRTWERAVESSDLELLTSLLGRADSDWFITQRQLLMTDRSLSRDAFDLIPISSEEESPTVELDPNWRQATVYFAQNYSYPIDEREKQPVQLTHTQFFELRGSNWRVVAPPNSFWSGLKSFDTEHLAVIYPGRDEAIVKQLANDLDREIDFLCDEFSASRECNPDWRIEVFFDPDPGSLLALNDTITPVMNGRVFELPAPSLVGIPTEEVAYHALYRGYTGRIISTLRNNFELPTPLPEQQITALCFPARGEGLALFSYNPTADVWTEQPVSRRYSTLEPLPEDSGLILRAGFPGVEMARLELVLRRHGKETPLFNEGTTELSARLVDIPVNTESESVLLSAIQGSTGRTTYRLLPFESCAGGACDVLDLQGFPLWSPSGGRTLVLVGSELYLGDSSGKPIDFIDRAFSPFWLTSDTFGYIRLRGNALDESPEMELVLGRAVSNDLRPLIKSAELLRQIDGNLTGGFRIRYVVADPNDPNRLFLAGTPIADGGNHFYIIALSLSGDIITLSPETALSRVEVLLSLDGLPVGDQSTLTPTGYPPFVLTPDGRWLTVVRFADPVTNTWELYLHNVARQETKVITLNYPAYPAPFPFYDWSADGKWLLLIDDGFLRLVAPDYDYERIITHEYVACRYPAWVNEFF